jgi:hypothetical protein
MNLVGSSGTGAYIGPSQVTQNPMVYASDSEQELNIVGVASNSQFASTTTFTSGSGYIEYCGNSGPSGTDIQTAENSNMYYETVSSYTGNCADGTIQTYYTQSFGSTYYLTMNLPFGGSPSSGNYPSESQQQISANSGPCYTYTHPYLHFVHYYWNGWSGSGQGSYSGGNNPWTITMGGNITENANYYWRNSPC